MKNLISEINRMKQLAGIITENTDNNKIQVWFDLDGVLADMQGALNSDGEINKFRNNLDSLIDSKFPEYKDLSDDKLKIAFRSALETDPNNQDLKKLKKVFRDYNNKVFGLAGLKGFYANISLIDGAHELVKKAYERTGVKPNVLSAPAGNENDLNNPSVIEKKEWVKKHFGDLINHIEITVDKGRVAKSKKDILIDDRDKYVDVFRSAGGSAIMFKNYKQAIQDLEKMYAELNEKD